MTRAAYPISDSTCGLAAKEQMISSAKVGNFRPLTTTGQFRIRCYFLDGGSQELRVTPQGLWAKILFRPGKDAGDVSACRGRDDDIHRLTRDYWQVLT